ncbi:MAG: hypothetical protein G01um101419_86 [Parcubacteria group bacterium Gr01-1014_19]|nr:MAG: hypothetical protein G01um101419_86 [Parcubacteria group bacterium Gr01-1014_19]
MSKEAGVVNNPVLETLDRLLGSKIFDSKVDSWLNYIRGVKDSFYGRTKAEKGVEAAEALLGLVVVRGKLREFAGSLKPIVQGLRAFAEADAKTKTSNKNVHLINDPKELRYPVDYDLRNITDAKMIVAFNPEIWACSCNPMPGVDAWHRNAALKLQAVVIQFSETRNFLELDLVFDPRKRPEQPSRSNKEIFVDEFVVLNISQDGHVHPKGERMQVWSCFFLLHSLGMFEKDRFLSIASSSGGSIEDALGFPGADDYLAKHIGELGGYFEAVARALGEKHNH